MDGKGAREMNHAQRDWIERGLGELGFSRDRWTGGWPKEPTPEDRGHAAQCLSGSVACASRAAWANCPFGAQAQRPLPLDEARPMVQAGGLVDAGDLGSDWSRHGSGTQGVADEKDRGGLGLGWFANSVVGLVFVGAVVWVLA